MSALGSGSISGEVGDAITQMMMQALEGMKMTSAGGESPKINSVISIGEISGIGDILDNAITAIVLRNMEERGLMSESPTGGSESPNGLPGASGLLGSARQTASLAQNPGALVSAGLSALPHAALVSFTVSLIPIIINELTRPGGQFDLRFKRIMEKEFNALQDRQTSYDISIGERGVIVQGRAGLLNGDRGGITDTNTLRTLREGGIDKNHLTQIDYKDHSKGVGI